MDFYNKLISKVFIEYVLCTRFDATNCRNYKESKAKFPQNIPGPFRTI